LIAEYLTRREDLIAPKTLKIERDLLQGVLAPALGDRLLADLEPIDFGKAVADYAGRLKREGRSNGTNANKLLAAASRMFKAARGWGVVGAADPTAGLTKPAKEAPRDRLLFDGAVLVGPDPRVNELGRLVCALTADPSPLPVSSPTRDALMLTLRLGLRALETCSLEWRAVDIDGRGFDHRDKVKDGRGLEGVAAAARRGRDVARTEGKFQQRPSVSFPSRSRVEARETQASGIAVSRLRAGLRSFGDCRCLDA
jgi:integrase